MPTLATARTERVVKLPRPFEHQVEELLHPARFKLSVHGRRWGKSKMGLIACLYGHGTDRLRKGALEGAKIGWVTKDYPTAKEIWEDLKAATWNAAIKRNEAELGIVLPGGGSVQVKSSEATNRGMGFDGLVGDEMAFWDETAWKLNLRATLSDKGKESWFWGITSPNGKNWFYRLFKAAESNQKWKTWRGPTTTATVEQEELDDIRKEVGSHAFAQEYMAEFETAGSGFFKPEHFRYFTNSGGTYKLDGQVVACDSCWRFATVDLAASTRSMADFTVVSLFAVTPKNDLLLIDLKRTRMEGPDQVPLIRRVYDESTPHPQQIAIESVGYQLALIQAARREGLPVVELKRDKDKVSRACLLQARMEGGNVWLPESAPFLRDLQEEMLSFPDGEHDDQVDTLADGAAYILKRNQPRVRAL